MTFSYPKMKLRLGCRFALMPGALSPRGANTVGCNSDSLRECDLTLMQLSSAREVQVQDQDVLRVLMDALDFCMVAGHCLDGDASDYAHKDWKQRQATFNAVLPYVIGAMCNAGRACALKQLEETGYENQSSTVMQWFAQYPFGAQKSNGRHRGFTTVGANLNTMPCTRTQEGFAWIPA